MAEPAGAGAFAGQVLPPVVIAGFALIAVATLAGAFLALRERGPREAWLGAAAGALLVIALLHLLPDGWSAAGAARIWPGTVPAAALGVLAQAAWLSLATVTRQPAGWRVAPQTAAVMLAAAAVTALAVRAVG